MPPFAAQQSLFRAYDIRGSHTLFTPHFIEALGSAFARLYTASAHHQKNTHPEHPVIVIGYDVRCGSDRIAQGLGDMLTHHGIQVIQLGLITTPMMAFWAQQYQGHGIVVTASHSAKDILGIKWLVAYKSPDSRQIQSLYQQLIITEAKSRLHIQTGRPARYTPSQTIDSAVSRPTLNLAYDHVATAYLDAIAQVFAQIYPSDKQADHRLSDKLDLVVVIDCMHGATSTIAQRLFERFCRHVIMLNDTPDGRFPTGNPDPTEPYRLRQLQQSVLAHHADVGMAFDGDGDRLMMVDNNGKVVSSDHLLYLLAQVALAECPKSLVDSPSMPQVLFDIKCSHHLPILLSQLGSTPIISKTGSSFMRQRMQRADSPIVFAGELSGHFIFNDSHFIIYDDAMYAALRLLHWLSAIDGKHALTKITQRLPAIVSTADHYLPMPDTAEQACPVVEQLARLCHHLYQIGATTIESASDHYPLNTAAPSLCECATNNHHVTLEQAQQLLPAGTRLSCIDGVRLDFAHGFGVLRQSNTSHSLTARFAGNTLADLQDIQAKFAALCRPFDPQLAEQITAMPAE